MNCSLVGSKCTKAWKPAAGCPPRSNMLTDTCTIPPGGTGPWPVVIESLRLGEPCAAALMLAVAIATAIIRFNMGVSFHSCRTEDNEAHPHMERIGADMQELLMCDLHPAGAKT